MNPYLKIEENSIFWNHSIEFSREMWYIKCNDSNEFERVKTQVCVMNSWMN